MERRIPAGAFIVESDRALTGVELQWHRFVSVWAGIAGYLGDLQRGFTSRAESLRKGYCERRDADVKCYCGAHQ